MTVTNVHNTLYVTTQGVYLRKHQQTIEVRQEKKTLLAVPMHHLGSVVCFGRVSVSPQLMKACADQGTGVSFLSERGRFWARVEGPTTGNVLLRRDQYRQADAPEASARWARAFVAGKLANCRQLLVRAARDAVDDVDREALDHASALLKHRLELLEHETTLDSIRGREGDGAAVYFGVFSIMLRHNREAFRLRERSRRPPRDAINALLSFLYTLVMHDVASAAQAVGLDPAVGYLHADRPGRPSLALDLMEELRPALAERLAISLINLEAIRPEDFTTGPTGGVSLTDAARKRVLVAYQKRKQEEIVHPFTMERITLGLVPFIQGRILARAIRGDLDDYAPFVIR